MRLLVFADLHLDTTFAWARPDVARKRRRALRDTLTRIIEVAREHDVAAILCAGDLYEHEQVAPDTGAFLCSVFGRAERPVLIAPGNHDWYGAKSLYAQVDWPSNVHVFRSERPTAYTLGDGVHVWGAAFHGPTRGTGFLEDFQADRRGLNLGLLHGSLVGAHTFEGADKSPHAPFREVEIRESGLRHLFAGHYHRPFDGPWHTYPGNPDPLTFGEDGTRGVVLVNLDSGGGELRRERRVVAVSQVHDLELDISHCRTSNEVRDAITTCLEGLTGTARLTVTGEVAPDISWEHQLIEDVPHELDEVVVRTRSLRAGYDIDLLSKEPTARGMFIRDVMGAELDEELRRRILVTGLRALDGRVDLEVP